MEFDEEKKTIKSINLDDFSVEDLEEYIITLEVEISRAKAEISKRLETKTAANKFFN